MAERGVKRVVADPKRDDHRRDADLCALLRHGVTSRSLTRYRLNSPMVRR
jgi:hypothetical protein